MKTISISCIAAFFVLLFVSCYNPISEVAVNNFFNDSIVNVKVYPIHVVTGQNISADFKLAENLVDKLNDIDRFHFKVSDKDMIVPIKWGHNQAKMLRNSAAYLQEQIKKQKPDSDFILLVELLCNPTETYVGGIHYYISSKKGELVRIQLTNSHWKVYQKVNPKNRNEGLLVATDMITAFLNSKSV